MGPTPRFRVNSILGTMSWSFGGLLGLMLLSLPAHAGRLEFWRFDAYRNRLDFRTESGVQPQAQLIANPTRLVIDLPGIVLGRPSLSQPGSGNIRAVRVAQFDRQTTRIVIEVAPGFTIDPNQVRFRGSSPTVWSVQIPNPQPVPDAPSPVTSPEATTGGSSPSAMLQEGQLTDVQVTPDGLFIETSGGPSSARVIRSRNRRQIDVTLEGLTLPPRNNGKTINVDRFGINRLQLQQVSGTSKPTVRLTLNVDRNGPNWQATIGRLGGVVLLPVTSISTIENANPPQSSISLLTERQINSSIATPVSASLATISAIDLGGDQVLIRGDRPLVYTNRWERNRYRITIRGAQFSPQLRQPRLGLGSALSNVEVRQEDAETISILMTPASGVRFQGIQPFSNNALLVQLNRPNMPPPDTSDPNAPVVVPSASPSIDDPLPTPSGRNVVVIDPGHGGRDPGAIGIGGIRETDIVLDISLEVARLLRQQGVIVRMTRTTEVEVDLAPRVAIAERANADAFVSIHANAISMSRPDINGLEVFYTAGRPRSARLASILHDSIVSSMNMGTRGVKTARFYVTRQTSMASALVETGFVTGAVDAPNLGNPAWRRRMAAAIARGILQYLRTQR